MKRRPCGDSSYFNVTKCNHEDTKQMQPRSREDTKKTFLYKNFFVPSCFSWLRFLRASTAARGSLLRGYPRLQLFGPMEHDVDAVERRRAFGQGHILDHQKLLTVRREVVRALRASGEIRR